MKKIQKQLTFTKELYQKIKTEASRQEVSMNYLISTIIHEHFLESTPILKRRYKHSLKVKDNTDRIEIVMSEMVYCILIKTACKAGILIKTAAENIVYDYFGYIRPTRKRHFKSKEVLKEKPMFEKDAFRY